MKGFFLALALVLASGFIAVPSFAHGGDHQNTTLAGAVMNGVDNEENREALKNFVMHAKAHIEEAVHIEDFFVLLSQFRDGEGDWIAHERSIYLYIFTAGETEQGHHRDSSHIAIFNALGPQSEGFDIRDMTDANGVEVAHQLVDVAAPQGDGFGEYTWDDPRIEGDEVNEPGKSPGTSPKVGYVVKVELPGGEQLTSTGFVLGSGFYPTPLADDSDDGCAIAGGTAGGGGPGSLFNLFLVASALFLAVSWKTRAVRR